MQKSQGQICSFRHPPQREKGICFNTCVITKTGLMFQVVRGIIRVKVLSMSHYTLQMNKLYYY